MTEASMPEKYSLEEQRQILDLSIYVLRAIQDYPKADEITPYLAISTLLFLVETGCSTAGMTKAQLSAALQSLLNNYTEENPMEPVDEEEV